MCFGFDENLATKQETTVLHHKGRFNASPKSEDRGRTTSAFLSREETVDDILLMTYSSFFALLPSSRFILFCRSSADGLSSNYLFTDVTREAGVTLALRSAVWSISKRCRNR